MGTDLLHRINDKTEGLVSWWILVGRNLWLSVPILASEDD